MTLTQPADPKEPGELFKFIAETRKCFSEDIFKDLSDKFNLVSIANNFGIIFVASQTCINVYKVNELIDTDNWKPFAVLNIKGCITQISTNCDDRALFVVTTINQCPHAYFFDVFHITETNVSKSPFYWCPLSSQVGTRVASFSWNPCDPSCLVVAISNGDLSLILIKEKSVEFVNKNKIGANCLGWSSKGKQLAVGLKDGTIALVKPDLSLVRTIPAAPIQGIGPVVSINWFTNTEFFIGYVVNNNSLNLCYVSGPKGKPATYTNFEDVCYSSENGKPLTYYTTYIPEWSLLLVLSSNGVEMGIIGKNGPCGQDGSEWCQWYPDDGHRASMQFHNVTMETFPLGLALERTNNKIFSDKRTESTKGPFPVLITLSTVGVLNLFFIENNIPNAQNVNVKSEQIISAGARTPQQFGRNPLLPPTVSNLPVPAEQGSAADIGKSSQSAFSIVPKKVEASTATVKPFSLSTSHATALDSAIVGVTPLEPQVQPPISQSAGTFVAPVSSQQGLLGSGGSMFGSIGVSQSFGGISRPVSISGQQPKVSLPAPSPQKSGYFQMGVPPQVTAAPQSIQSGIPVAGTAKTTVSGDFQLQFPATALGSTQQQLPQDKTSSIQQVLPTSQQLPPTKQQLPPTVQQIPASNQLLTTNAAQVVQTSTTQSTSRTETPTTSTLTPPVPKYSEDILLHHLKKLDQYFDKEMRDFLNESRSIPFQVGTKSEDEDIKNALYKTSEWIEDMEKTTNEQNREVRKLHQATLEALASHQDVATHMGVKSSQRNKIYLELRPLDPYSQRKLDDITSKYSYLINQMNDVSDKLDLQWQEYSNMKRSKRLTFEQKYMAENLYRSVLNLYNKRVSMESQLSSLAQKLKKLSIFPPTFTSPKQSLSSRVLETTSLEKMQKSFSTPRKDGTLKTPTNKTGTPDVGIATPEVGFGSPATPSRKSGGLKQILSKRLHTPVRKSAEISKDHENIMDKLKKVEISSIKQEKENPTPSQSGQLKETPTAFQVDQNKPNVQITPVKNVGRDSKTPTKNFGSNIATTPIKSNGIHPLSALSSMVGGVPAFTAENKGVSTVKVTQTSTSTMQVPSAAKTDNLKSGFSTSTPITLSQISAVDKSKPFESSTGFQAEKDPLLNLSKNVTAVKPVQVVASASVASTAFSFASKPMTSALSIASSGSAFKTFTPNITTSVSTHKIEPKSLFTAASAAKDEPKTDVASKAPASFSFGSTTFHFGPKPDASKSETSTKDGLNIAPSSVIFGQTPSTSSSTVFSFSPQVSGVAPMSGSTLFSVQSRTLDATENQKDVKSTASSTSKVLTLTTTQAPLVVVSTTAATESIFKTPTKAMEKLNTPSLPKHQTDTEPASLFQVVPAQHSSLQTPSSTPISFQVVAPLPSETADACEVSTISQALTLVSGTQSSASISENKTSSAQTIFGTSTVSSSTSNGQQNSSVFKVPDISSSILGAIDSITTTPATISSLAASTCPSTTTTASSLFGGGIFSTQTPATSSVFGTAQTAGPFGVSSSVVQATSASGVPQSSSLPFGTIQSSSSAFAAPQSSSSGFGVPQSTGPTFGSSSQLFSGSAFATPQVSSSSIFGGGQSGGSLFGNQKQGSAFGVPQTSSSAFGVSQNTSSVFGVPQTSTSAFGAQSQSTGSTFPQSSSGTIFGTSQTGASPFGAPQSGTSIFGGTSSQASGTGVSQPISVIGSAQSGGSVFGGTQSSGNSAFGAVSSSGSIFGGTQTTSAFGSGTSSAFQNKPVFGQSASSGSGTFGTTASPFTASIFNKGDDSNPVASGEGLFCGLGKAPNPENANKNVFGVTQGAQESSTQNIFGGSSSSPFGSKPAGFGTSAPSTGSIFGGQQNPVSTQSAFGSSPTTGSAFGAKPVFGSSTGFGAKPVFGSGSSFGAKRVFGGNTGSVFGGSSTGSGSTFGGGGSSPFGTAADTSGGTGFGDLAQKAVTPPQQQSGFSSFGGNSFNSWR